MKYYHLYADRKTVKELTWKEYLRLSRSKVAFKLVCLGKDWIGMCKGKDYIGFSLRQLEEILSK